VLWPRRSCREGNQNQLLVVTEESGHRGEEDRKRISEGLEVTQKHTESRQDRFEGSHWNPIIPEGYKSLTAFFLDQANRRPWTDDLNTQRKSWDQNVAANKKLRSDIIDYATKKAAPFTAREIMDAFESDKSRVDAALRRHQRENTLRRFNHNGRLHWVLT
jgi:hypothetical protein